MASEGNEAAPGEEPKVENGGKFANGTLLYWKFENGNYWGSIKGHEDSVYKTSWSDGDVHNLKEDMISSMVYHAQETLTTIPDKYENGTRVQKYFEDEGGWWEGKIVNHDTNHNYTVKWSDGRLEQWNALYTVAMVHDAADFQTEMKESAQDDQRSNISMNSSSSSSSDSGSRSASGSGSKSGSKDEKTDESVDGVEADENDDSSIESDVGDAILADSIPHTEKGIAEYLRQIDGLPPAENGDHLILEDAVYHANVKIENSAIREIPIPIFVPDSLVEWAVRIEEHDIKFAIRPASSEEEPLVESHYLYARTEEEEHEEQDTEGVNGDEVNPTESGQFTVHDSAAVLIFEFDNRFSWFTEKSISYHVKVSPPRQPGAVDRAERALPYVLKALDQAKYEVDFARQRVTKAAQNIVYTRNRYRKLGSDIDRNQQQLENVQMAVQNFDNQRLEEEQKLLLQRKRLSDKETCIQKLEQRMRELEQERLLCWKEKQQLENSVYDMESELLQFDDKCNHVHHKAEELNSELCDMQIELLMEDSEIADVQAALREAELGEVGANRQVTFMERLVGALKARLHQ